MLHPSSAAEVTCTAGAALRFRNWRQMPQRGTGDAAHRAGFTVLGVAVLVLVLVGKRGGGLRRCDRGAGGRCGSRRRRNASRAIPGAAGAAAIEFEEEALG